MKVKDTMHKDVEWRSPATSLQELAKLMKACDIGAVPNPFDSFHKEMDRMVGDYFKRFPAPHLGFRSDGAGRLFANLDLSESDTEVMVVRSSISGA